MPLSEVLGCGGPHKCCSATSAAQLSENLQCNFCFCLWDVAGMGFRGVGFSQWTAKGASGKGPRQKPSKTVKNRQKVSKNIFDTFRQFSHRAKTVQNRQKVSKLFSTLFDNFRARHLFSGALKFVGGFDLGLAEPQSCSLEP